MSPPTPFSDPTVSVETPERVQLCLDVAGLGTRAMAYLVDFAILILFWSTTEFAIAYLRSGHGLVDLEELRGLRSSVQALLVFAIFFVQWGYWVGFETLWAGRSPGKRALRIRVIKLDGSPVGFGDVALRNLGRVVDFLPALYAVGLVAMTVSPRSRRLGDLLAGTVVVRERRVDLSRYEAPAAASRALAMPLSASEYELVTSFLSRAARLEPSARERVALKLAEPLARRLSAERLSAALESGAAAEAFLQEIAAGHG
jgi:uncharacterized RDD family membrane protein YckC